MTIIMQNAAALLLAVRLSKKKSGTPMSAAAPKHISCRLVSPNSTLDFTFVKSFGMVTYANLFSVELDTVNDFEQAQRLIPSQLY